MAPARVRGAQPGNNYVVCLDCGQRFAYDSTQWKIGARLPSDVDELQRFANTRYTGNGGM